MMSKFLVSVAIAGAMIFGSSAAMADSTSKPAVKTTEEGDSYGYKFDDDVLGAGVMGAQNGMIKVRQGIVRRTLIRPRTHFVPELLKSIELI